MVQYTLEGPKWGTPAYGTSGGQVTWSFANLNYAGQPFQWDAPISDAASQQVIRQAFAKWESVCNIDFVEAADGSNTDVRLGWDAIDGAYNTVGQCYYSYSGNVMTDAQIRFDTAERWSTSPGQSGMSLYAVALHEIGHALGLDHYEGGAALMNAVAGAVSDLAQSDIAGARALYGPAASGTAPGVPESNATPTSQSEGAIHGTSGADNLVGTQGNDILIGGAGADALSGGLGSDSVSYETAGAGVTASLTKPSANTGDAKGDTYSSIENLLGSNFADKLTGDAGNNVIDGRGGVDQMAGGSGNDTYIIDNAADTVIEKAKGGSDTILALVDYTLANKQQVETLRVAGSGDIALSGNDLTNAIYGNAGNNVLRGGAGNDSIFGGDGNDLIFGNAGSDMLHGGNGSDTFFFDDKPKKGVVDTIVGFSTVDDTIALASKAFAAAGAAGQLSEAAYFVSADGRAHDADDRIVYNSSTGDLFFDADGTGKKAGVLFAHLDPGLSLSAADFIILA